MSNNNDKMCVSLVFIIASGLPLASRECGQLYETSILPTKTAIRETKPILLLKINKRFTQNADHFAADHLQTLQTRSQIHKT